MVNTLTKRFPFQMAKKLFEQTLRLLKRKDINNRDDKSYQEVMSSISVV